MCDEGGVKQIYLNEGTSDIEQLQARRGNACDMAPLLPRAISMGISLDLLLRRMPGRPVVDRCAGRVAQKRKLRPA